MEIQLQNLQPVKLNLSLIRRILVALVTEVSPIQDVDLKIEFVDRRRMARLNRLHMNHSGSTDVITIDYLGGEAADRAVAGELLVCVGEAMLQARRFQTSWQSELVRYLIHGVLHLRGYDDVTRAKRLIMRQEENRLLEALSRRFDLRKVTLEPTLAV